MIKVENNKLILSILSMLLTLLISDMMYFTFKVYPIYLSFYFLLYIIGYIYIILFSKEQLSLNGIIFLFIVMKFYIFVIASFDNNYAINVFGLHETGDSVRYHIKLVLDKIHTIDDAIYYLLFSLTDFSGRLLRTFLYFYTEILLFLGFDNYNVINIGKITYIFNILISIVTLYLVYSASFVYSNSALFARRSVFFLGCNPFFFKYTAAPLKETFIFLSLALFLKFIVDLKIKGKKNYFLFFISLVIIFFDRLYMIPLFLGIFLYLNDNKKSVIIIFSFSIIAVELLLGVQKAFYIYLNFRENITSIGDSVLGNNHGVVSNLFRTLFGPAFIRPFLASNTTGSILYILQYMSYLLLYYIAVKSIFYRKGLESIVFLSLIYIFLFWPFHSTLKITILVVFSTIFLDKISFVKLKK